ncbi:MAG: GDSL-type esterase/lipase family protein [Polyangiaceae bacterium]
MSEQIERGIALGLAGLAALVGITCASRAQLDSPAKQPVSAASAPPAQAAIPARPISSARAALPPAAPPVPSGDLAAARAAGRDPTQLELPHFYAELAGLEQRKRKTAVRIFWLGDSHTAADYLTGAVRARLQTRFGAGGPGFVRVGVKPYRHTQVRWSCDGPWRIEPAQPARRTPFDDGVFALDGIRSFPDGAPAQAGFELSPGTAHGQVHWQVWFSLGEAASFRVSLAGVTQVVSKGSGIAALPGAGFASLPLEGGLADKLELVTLSGAPRFYGVIAEGSEPGLVLDAVGIDGARVATALAWNEASFEAAVRARAPSLAVFAFGTNEAFDTEKIEKYRPQYQALLARVRVGAPDADCLIVGPPDANAVAGGSEPRVAEIDALQRSVAGELGCGYLSQLEIMGGPGGYTRWANKTPPLARGDRLHLSVKGYEQMANAIGDRLLAAYARKALAAH